MIFTDRVITVRRGESKIDENIIVYRGDYEVKVRFKIMNSKFIFMGGTNIIESENASFGQLAILTPYGGNIFSEISECSEGAVTFTLSRDMLDQIEEVGLYSFQIRLFDENQESRASIPPVVFGIEIREPIASEDHDNTVNNAIVGYSIAKVIDPSDEKVPNAFDDTGVYNKTAWTTGDRITEGKLNKMEDALFTINQNGINNNTTLDRRITNNFNILDSIKADKNEVFTMANMGPDVKAAMTGGSVAIVGTDSIDSLNIKNDIINPDKTSFITTVNYLKVDRFEPTTIISTVDGKTLLDVKYNANESLSEILECRYNETYTLGGAIYDNPAYVFFADASYNILSYITIRTSDRAGTSFTVPQNAYYMRVRMYTTKVDKAMLVKGGPVPTLYTPYGLTVDNLVMSSDQLKDIKQAIVDPELTYNMLNDRIQTVNLIDQSKVQSGITLAENPTSLITPINNANYTLSAVLGCKPGETYAVNYDMAGSSTRIYFSDAEFTILHFEQMTKNADGVSSTYSTVPEGACYMRISFPTTKLATAMLVKGTKAPNDYTPFKITIQGLTMTDEMETQITEIVKNDLIEPDDLPFVTIMNHINKDKFEPDTIISIDTYTTLLNTKVGAGNSLSPLMKCASGEVYSLDGTTAGQSCYVFFGDANYNILSYLVLGKVNSGASPTTFTVPNGACYMRLRLPSNRLERAMLFKGTTVSHGYTPYSFTMPALIDPKDIKVTDKNLRFLVVSDIHYGRDDRLGSSDVRMEQLINVINDNHCEKPFDFVLVNGDIVDYTGNDDAFKELADKFLWRMPCPLFCSVGNHDVVSDDVWVRTFGHKRQFTFETDDFYFICLDSYHQNVYKEDGKREYSGADIEYLEAELAKANELRKYIVVIHHEHDGSIDTEFATICMNAGVLLRLVAHTHIPEHTVVNNMFRLNSGKWIFDTLSTNSNYNIIEIQNNELVATAYAMDINGNITSTKSVVLAIDKFTAADIQLTKFKNNALMINKINNLAKNSNPTEIDE